MSETWKEWSGQRVNGTFPLWLYIGGTEHSAVFLTERDEGGVSVRAAIKLIPSLGEDDEGRLARWRQAAEMSHPNLLRVYAMGRSEINHVPVLYVVMEFAEESLAEVLKTRALEPEEVRPAFEAALEALGYLHGQGLLHGHVKPSNIMAIGDVVKLSNDTIHGVGEPCEGLGRPDAYDPPEAARGIIPVAEGLSPAADVWSLGMTLVEVLTQKLPDLKAAGADEVVPAQGLPEPFLDITRHSLLRNPRNRWSIAEIAARLRNAAAVATPAVPSPVAPPIVSHVSRQAPPRGSRKSSWNYAVPVAVGLILAAVIVPRLLHHPEVARSEAAAATSEPATDRAAKANDPANKDAYEPAPENRQAIPVQPESTTALRRDSATGGVIAPARLPSEAARVEIPAPDAKLPAGTVVKGAVAQQVLPDVLESARDTITGRVKIVVKVDVDPSGDVEKAEIASPAASKYFGRVALQAAQRWKFTPPKVAGRNVLSSWSLRFEFSHDGTRGDAVQEIP